MSLIRQFFNTPISQLASLYFVPGYQKTILFCYASRSITKEKTAEYKDDARSIWIVVKISFKALGPAYKQHKEEGFPLLGAYMSQLQNTSAILREEMMKLDHILKKKRKDQYRRSAVMREFVLAMQEKRDLLET